MHVRVQSEAVHMTAEAAGDVAAGQQGRASPRFGPPKIAVRGTLKSVQAANQTGSVLVSCCSFTKQSAQNACQT